MRDVIKQIGVDQEFDDADIKTGITEKFGKISWLTKPLKISNSINSRKTVKNLKFKLKLTNAKEPESKLPDSFWISANITIEISWVTSWIGIKSTSELEI